MSGILVQIKISKRILDFFTVALQFHGTYERNLEIPYLREYLKKVTY